MKTKEECKNEIARNNNFDSFERAIRYTFNRELLPSEKDFIDKIIDEAMEEYALQQVKNNVVSCYNCINGKCRVYNSGESACINILTANCKFHNR